MKRIQKRSKLLRKRLMGMTLLEVMITAAIIAIVATLAIPHYLRARMFGQNGQVVNDLRTFGYQFEVYATEQSGWPEDRMPGNFPPEMEGMINPEDWDDVPPVGGQYDWDNANRAAVLANETQGFYAVAIANHLADEQQCLLLDDMIDDGDLTTGSFQEVSSGLVWILQKEEE
jgi:prepilin-type N-terminal cleavage/methylation domain-containing protein